MPQLSAASSRDRPSKTSAIASIRRAALASRVRAAARRKSPADRSRRVIATAMSASAPGQWRSESRRRPKRGHVRVIGQGAWYKVYRLPHVLLFSILAIVSGGNSYRSVATFIDVHRQRLNRTFGLTWRPAPAHTSIRNILQGLDSGALEAVFRRHAGLLQTACAKPGAASLAIDGKTLRGSFDQFRDRAAAQVLGVFATDTALVLAHSNIDDKSNEIPAAQALLAQLGLAGHLVTLDALHCQRRHSKPAQMPRSTRSYSSRTTSQPCTSRRRISAPVLHRSPTSAAAIAGVIGRRSAASPSLMPPAPSPIPSGPPSSAPSSASSVTSSPAAPAPASGAAPPRPPSTSPAPPSPPPALPSPSEITGRSRTPPTTAVTSPWARIARASASTPASSQGSAASPSTSSSPTAEAHSPRTASAPPSAASIASSTSSAFQSVEQPCRRYPVFS